MLKELMSTGLLLSFNFALNYFFIEYCRLKPMEALAVMVPISLLASLFIYSYARKP